MEHLVLVVEGVIALAATWLAWGGRWSGLLAYVLRGVLLGMAWCAFLHGLCFGVLRVEGAHAERDPGLLAGFGLAAAVFAGIPLGLALGVASGLASRRRVRRARADDPIEGASS